LSFRRHKVENEAGIVPPSAVLLDRSRDLRFEAKNELGKVPVNSLFDRVRALRADNVAANVGTGPFNPTPLRSICLSLVSPLHAPGMTALPAVAVVGSLTVRNDNFVESARALHEAGRLGTLIRQGLMSLGSQRVFQSSMISVTLSQSEEHVTPVQFPESRSVCVL